MSADSAHLTVAALRVLSPTNKYGAHGESTIGWGRVHEQAHLSTRTACVAKASGVAARGLVRARHRSMALVQLCALKHAPIAA